MQREGYRANVAPTAATSARPGSSTLLGPLAAEQGLAHVATGTNADDAVAGFRPGIGAAPSAVRSHRCATPASPRPRSAPRPGAGACRPGTSRRRLPVVPRRLRRRGDAVPAGEGGRAEAAVRAALADAGLLNLRVRDLGDRASVEIDAALLPLAPEVEEAVLSGVRAAGFDEALVDRRGFRSGSMNEAL